MFSTEIKINETNYLMGDDGLLSYCRLTTFFCSLQCKFCIPLYFTPIQTMQGLLPMASAKILKTTPPKSHNMPPVIWNFGKMIKLLFLGVIPPPIAMQIGLIFG